jgi:Zn-dependent M32 family carboxypeptidase
MGAFLKTRIFARGSTLHWQDLLREATGRPLSTDAFVSEFAARSP